ncbi:DUF2125 domain-containing protein [Halocynthiibacter namhaensis]|uniref:DUF2125 domain-containing protein n=1 Tax=Halocynthiibacter namhaensis TaxID=1290553 RepID=UPI000579398D|nr:DUF2125 domain-containing protein [Halocynthiibacter namhaensis]
MRGLIIFILFIFIGWAGYWIVGSTTLENQLKTAIDEAQDQGIDLRYSEFGVQGFPNRFDTVMRDLDLKIPSQNIEWTAPLFVTAALSYKPWHLIATWPQEQSLRVGDFQADILTSEMQASVVFKPNTSLPLDRSQLVAKDLRINGLGAEQLLAVAETFVATRVNPSIPNAHNLLVDLKQVQPPRELMAHFNPDQALPPRLSAITSDATLEFSAPLDRENLPELLAIGIKSAALQWGNITLQLEGRLEPGVAGQATGQLVLTARSWKQAFQVLVDAGIAQPGWEGLLAALTLADGNPDTLTAPLVFQDGQIWFGPFPIGRSPVIFPK